MKEFVLVFRMDITTKEAQPSKEQMEGYMQQWMLWIDEIEEKDQLVDGGLHFSKEGRVLMSNNKVLNTPYIAHDNSVAGYIIILADNIDGATEIAKRCPILAGENTSVEIREVGIPGE